MGQNTGKRDNRGTKTQRLIGIVESKTLVCAGGEIATYKLFLRLTEMSSQREIRRSDGDGTTHQTVLREEGFYQRSGWMS